MSKKVGFLITSVSWGGLEINVVRLAQWVEQRNIQVILFAVPGTRIFTEAQNLHIPIVAIQFHRKYFDLIPAIQFGRLLKKHAIHDLMIFDNKDMDFANLVKRSLGNNLRLIYQQQMQLGVPKRDPLHSFRFSSLDYWISPLDWLKQEVLTLTHIKEEKIKVIPLGVEIQKFINPKYTKSEARQKLDINTDALVVGIIGRIDPMKGQLFLVEAITKIRSSGLPLELLIMGDPTVNSSKSIAYIESIRSIIASENLSRFVHFHSHTSDVNLFYNAIDIFALASKGETFGMVTVEAMLSRVPIIATNSSGTPEILQYGKLGTLYTPDDLNDFCNKLIYMVTHLEESLEMATKAQSYARDTFGHEHECELMEQLLTD